MKTVLLLSLLWLVPALRAAEPEKYAWDPAWPRFRTSEYVVTGAAVAGAAALYFWAPPPKTARWKGSILFDKNARDALMIRSESADKRATSVSDALAYSLVGYAALDGPVTAGWHGGNKDAAAQLAWINAETFGVVEVLNLGVSEVVTRERPEGDVCPPNSKYDPHCTKSFWSGHAANAFAAESLVCTEHGAMYLYGGKADAAACGTALAAASAVGVLRIAENAHHASDVVVGAGVGAAAGYMIPHFLHFKTKRRGDLGYVVPNAGPRGGGLTYVKAW